MKYDLETVYDEQIAPLMTQIIAICREHNLPMVASFAYRQDEEGGASFCSTVLNDEPRSVDKYDQIRKLLLRGTTIQ